MCIFSYLKGQHLGLVWMVVFPFIFINLKCVQNYSTGNAIKIDGRRRLRRIIDSALIAITCDLKSCIRSMLIHGKEQRAQ